ncbi:MAG: hypothetical protein EOP49_05200 [Sphingobacteriales bacterium]|nr:MAG: hypothetical protein EOP49_05200 [Sphingobacteriales bacterium]
MLRTRTMIGSGCLLIVLLAGGFMLLLRACLSQYDERAAILPATVYQHDTSAIIVALVNYDETSSYESGPGFTRKTVNTSYYIQSNDLYTAQKIRSAKLKEHAEIKEWPVKIFGTAPGIIWIYLGELMAIDPNTLQTIARIESLESVNKGLQGRFPKEQRFYRYNPADQHMYFTATDGSTWKIANKTWQAARADEAETTDHYLTATDSLARLEKQIQVEEDSLNNVYSREPYQLYRQGKISSAEYQRSLNYLADKRKEFRRERDLIRKSGSRARSARLESANRQSAINSMERVNPGYSQMSVNTDTANGKWMGLYTQKEFTENDGRIRLNRLYGETARRNMFSGDIIYDGDGNANYDTARMSLPMQEPYLQGGFLLNKMTAVPFRLANGNRLVIHKDVIGRTGKTLLTMTDDRGKRIWTTETGLESWSDWQLIKNRLVIFGLDNKELSGEKANLLLIIDLSTGKQSRYDYFTEKS